MFEKKDKRTQLEKEIDAVLECMSDMHDPTSEEYRRCMATLDDLTRIEERRNSHKPQKRSVDPNTVMSLGVSVFELFAVMNYEQLRVFAGKAFGWIHRPRI